MLSFLFLMMFMMLLMNFIWMGNIIILENFFNIWLFYLSFFISMMIILTDKNKMNNFLVILLILISFIFFFNFNMIIMYMFFELSLIPIMLMSMIFGMQIEKINSINYLLMYSLGSSLPFLILMLNLEFFDFFYFLMNFSYEYMMILIMMFLVKFPIYFFHLWLPKLHVEASTSASMILAGLLLKFGSQGFYRFLKMMEMKNLIFLLMLSLFGFLLGSMLCLFQSDIKSLIAFSSVVHMSFMLFIFLNFMNLTKNSTFLLMISHGLISTMIFFLVGEFLHFNLSRLIYFFNNIFINNFFMMMMFSIFLMLNSGFPPNISFFSELLSFFINFNMKLNNFFLIGFFMFFGFLFNFFLIINLNSGKFYIFNNFFSNIFLVSWLFLSFNWFIFLM